MDQHKVLISFCTLLEEHTFDEVTYAMWAEAADVKTSELYEVFPDKKSIIQTLIAKSDEAMAEAFEGFDESLSVEDKLFDLLMTHFEALNPYKPIFKAFFKSCHVVGGIDFIDGYKRLDRILTLAGDDAPLPKIIVLKGFSVVYLRFFYVWMEDESEDLSKTMAEVQKRLLQGKKWMASIVDNPLFSMLY